MLWYEMVIKRYCEIYKETKMFL